MYDVVIVGAGPAGIACALRCRELNLDCVVLEEGVVANTIADYPKGKKIFGVPGFFQQPADKLIKFYKKDLERADIEVHEHHKVDNIRRLKTRFVVNADSKRFESKSVVLAVGVQALPRTLGIPGEEQDNIHYKLKDPKRYSRKKIMVIGGGDTAVETAIHLSKAGAKVILSYRKEKFFRVKDYNLKDLEKTDVDVRFMTNLVGIEDKTAHLKDCNGNIEKIGIDDAFICLGTVKNTPFFEKIGLELDKDGNIIHDKETYETSMEGLFVAGDIANEKLKLIMPAMYHGFKVAAYIRQHDFFKKD